MMTRLRIDLEVEATFTADGNIKPHDIIYKDRTLHITKVVRTRKFCPPMISCFAPTELTVLIEGKERQIYFEQCRNKWFSVKEVYN